MQNSPFWQRTGSRLGTSGQEPSGLRLANASPVQYEAACNAIKRHLAVRTGPELNRREEAMLDRCSTTWLTRFRTNHWELLNQYRYRIGRSPSEEGQLCQSAEVQSNVHLFRCSALKQARISISGVDQWDENSMFDDPTRTAVLLKEFTRLLRH